MVDRRAIQLITYYLLLITFPHVATAQPTSQDNDIPVVDSEQQEFIVIPVGINLGKRNVLPSALVKGLEDGSQAIDFQNWLIPFDTVIESLRLDITPLEDGQLEVRSPGLVTRIDPDQLQNDPELGLVISVKEIFTLLNVPAEFDINEYAIAFNPPWLDRKGKTKSPGELPVILEGLPKLEPEGFTFTNLAQTVNLTNNVNGGVNYQGELTALGTVVGSSWFVKVNQSDLTNGRSWRIGETQLLRQTATADYVLGSQPTFWRSQGGGEYWGLTTIQRWGFTPTVTFNGGGFSPSQRLQANQVGRTIVGEAEPGTLVQLTTGFAASVVAEVLVDSSGVYRFEDIPTKGTTYRVFLFPNGQLTAEPEIQEANFSTLPTQLPAGASALTVSGGGIREFEAENDLWGSFTDWRGGIAYRRGVSEDLTLGVGLVYDEELLGLGEFFYQPQSLPLQVTVSALVDVEGGEGYINANLRFQPSRNFSLNLDSDQLSNRFNLNWQLFPGLTLTGNGNSRDRTLAGGFRVAHSSRYFSLFATASLDTDNNLRWSLNKRLGNLRLTYQGNEITTVSELTYGLSGSNSLLSGHTLFIAYDSRNLNNINNDLLSLGWRYRSTSRTLEGRNLWEFDLGYGWGSNGRGIIASLGVALPGLSLRLRYQEVSVSDSSPSFRVELLPSFNLQRGEVLPGEQDFERLRSQGGLWIQPFFDSNNNGIRDRGEQLYLETPELLFILNNQPLKFWRNVTYNHGIFVFLPPGIYRLDLDPAGFPLDWQGSVKAYAAEVVSGSYTPMLVPLNLSYTVTGVVTNLAGDTLGGARVEAIPKTGGQRIFSITNDAGVFYLEGLQQGEYDLLINEQPAQPGLLQIEGVSEPFQELNLLYGK